MGKKKKGRSEVRYEEDQDCEINEKFTFREKLKKLKKEMDKEEPRFFYCDKCKETVKIMYEFSDKEYMLACNHVIPKEYVDKEKKNEKKDEQIIVH